MLLLDLLTEGNKDLPAQCILLTVLMFHIGKISAFPFKDTISKGYSSTVIMVQS